MSFQDFIDRKQPKWTTDNSIHTIQERTLNTSKRFNASRSKRQKEKLEEDYKEHYKEIKLSTRDNERKHIDIIAKGAEDAANNGEQNSQYKRVI